MKIVSELEPFNAHMTCAYIRQQNNYWSVTSPSPKHTYILSLIETGYGCTYQAIIMFFFSVGYLLRVYFCNFFLLSRWSPSLGLHYISEHKDTDVYVMDSLGGIFPISPSLKRQIAQVYGGRRSQLIIRRLSVQQQVGAKDCGLFAVAFAVEVCQRNDPSRVSYDHSKMRSHFASCLEKGHMDTFPRGRKSQENIPRPKGQSTSIPVLVKPACRSRTSSRR